MKPFLHDHPLRDTPPGALSCDELRFWIRYLTREAQPRWRPTSLARAFGCGGKIPAATLLAKIGEKEPRAWIYPSEQLRFSKQLGRVLAGELEPVTVNGLLQVRVVDQPQPVRLPARWRFDLKRGKLERHPFRMPQYRDTLPSFHAVMGTETWAGRWND